jgi:hypothetical protein
MREAVPQQPEHPGQQIPVRHLLAGRQRGLRMVSKIATRLAGSSRSLGTACRQYHPRRGFRRHWHLDL